LQTRSLALSLSKGEAVCGLGVSSLPSEKPGAHGMAATAAVYFSTTDRNQNCCRWIQVSRRGKVASTWAARSRNVAKTA